MKPEITSGDSLAEIILTTSALVVAGVADAIGANVSGLRDVRAASSLVDAEAVGLFAVFAGGATLVRTESSGKLPYLPTRKPPGNLDSLASRRP